MINHVIPVTTETIPLLKMAMECIESALKTSREDYSLTIIDNNPVHSDELMKFSINGFTSTWKKGEFNYLIHPSKFNLNKTFNIGSIITKSDLVCYSNMDLIFYENWHFEIEMAFLKSGNKYHTICPITISENKGLCYTDSMPKESALIECDHPAGWCMVQRQGYVWDESFDFWEADHDYWQWLKFTGRKAAVCTGAVIKHGQSVVMKKEEIDMSATERLKKKWEI